MWIQKKIVRFLFNFKAYGMLERNVTRFRILRGSVKAFLLYGCENWTVTKRPTRVLQTFINGRLTKIFQVFCLTLSLMRNCGGVHERKSVALQINLRKWK